MRNQLLLVLYYFTAECSDQNIKMIPYSVRLPHPAETASLNEAFSHNQTASKDEAVAHLLWTPIEET